MRTNSPNLLVAFIIAACLLAQPTGSKAQTNTTGSTRLQVEATNVSENRQQDGKCYVYLKFTGNSLIGKLGILRVRALRAMDDVGTNLILPGDSESTGWGASGDSGLAPLRGWYDGRSLGVRSAGVALRNSSRSAKNIEVLEAEVELYSPTIENGGVVVLENFCARPGVACGNDTLKRFGLNLVYLTKECYETARSSSNAAPTSGRQLVGPLDRDADHLFPGILENQERTSRNYLVFKIDDPQRRITGFAFREPGGRLLPVRQRRAVNDMHGFYFDAPVSERLALLVYLDVPDAVEKVPFRIGRIPLP